MGFFERLAVGALGATVAGALGANRRERRLAAEVAMGLVDGDDDSHRNNSFPSYSNYEEASREAESFVSGAGEFGGGGASGSWGEGDTT